MVDRHTINSIKEGQCVLLGANLLSFTTQSFQPFLKEIVPSKIDFGPKESSTFPTFKTYNSTRRVNYCIFEVTKMYHRNRLKIC